MKSFSKQLGVTLSELVITVSVVAIMAGLSAPAYSKFISKRKISVAANMIGVFFENVKMEAIKRNEFVTISYQSEEEDGSWCIGATVGSDAECDCMAETPECLIDTVPTILSSMTYADFSKIETDITDGFITFDPKRGILLDPADSVLMEVTHASENFQVDVSVNATGSVRKCSPEGHELVGYATCI